MSTKSITNHDLRSVDSGTIYLPPNASIGNLHIPKLHETSTGKLYDIATKYVFNDKVFRYCQADTGGKLICSFGAGNKNAISIAYTTLSYPDANATTVAAVVGATSVYVVKAGATKDEYKGGHAILGHNSDPTLQNRGIVGNDKAATVAGVSNVVKIDLDFPLQIALVAATSGIEVSKSIYSNVKKPDDWHFTVVCVPCVYVATNAGEYFWGQTWGPVWLTPAATGFGNGSAGAGHEREVYFHAEGSLWENYLNYNGSYSLQRAGYILDYTGSPEDTSLIMLQLAP